MRKTNQNYAILKESIIDYVTFMLHKNAEYYGYNINYNANAKTTMRYVRDIFELECDTDSDYVSLTELKAIFKGWVNDLDCIISVIDNIDYTDKFTLNAMTPAFMHSASESDKIDFINDVIFEAVFGRF